MVTKQTLDEAIAFATRAHRGGYRKANGMPYITHPMSVMKRVMRSKESSNPYLLAVCSVLHDTVEDCGVTLEDIAKAFGYQVAAIVDELSLDKNEYQTVGKTELLCRELTNMSSYALCIKLCDRADNLEDMKGMSLEFRERYIKETEDILKHVVMNRKHITKTHYTLMTEIKDILSAEKLRLRNEKKGY